VECSKPLGVVFQEGPDGAVYVGSIEKNGNADKTGMFQVGDKIKEVSATFGDEMWPAANADFQRILSAIKTRQFNVRLLLERQLPN